MKIVGFASELSDVHDNSLALMDNGKILFAEASERITRKKHDGAFPLMVLKEALSFTKTKLREIDYFATAYPGQNFFQTIKANIMYLPHVGIRNFLRNIFKRLLYKKETINKNNNYNSFYQTNLPVNKLIKVSHYLAHAASAYYSCPFDTCIVLTMDGFGQGQKGEPLSGQVFLGKDKKLELLESLPVHSSLGLYYGVVTIALGFKLNDGEGKTMGLAAYGNPKLCYNKMKKFFPNFINGKWTVRNSIMDVQNVARPKAYLNSNTDRLLKKWVKKYGRENVAASCQLVFEEELIKYIKYLVKKYNMRIIAVAGGIFLNVKANMRLIKEKVLDDIFVYPNPSDGGTAVGAAMIGFVLKNGTINRSELLHPAFGRSYSDKEIIKILNKNKDITHKKIFRNLPHLAARLISQGKVIGWFQGKGEWGPRALGQRSVIADPRKIEMKDRINNILKGREWFMPFAPSMLFERSDKYLGMLKKAPFMVIADDLKKKELKNLKAVTHVDFTVRPHLVTQKANSLYYQVIKEFEKLTGVGVILNTSFNKHGLPIVYSPQDAVDHLKWGAIDELIIGNYHVKRK